MPSRTDIEAYGWLTEKIGRMVQRLNEQYATDDWVPVHLLEESLPAERLAPLYRAADLCLVNSLQDGMNLVAKEFVAARDGGGGVLILSQFAGASRELRDALIANPYATEQPAEAIRYALEIGPDERAARLRRPRAQVQDHNGYRWAGNLVTDLTQIRLEQDATARVT